MFVCMPTLSECITWRALNNNPEATLTIKSDCCWSLFWIFFVFPFPTPFLSLGIRPMMYLSYLPTLSEHIFWIDEQICSEAWSKLVLLSCILNHSTFCGSDVFSYEIHYLYLSVASGYLLQCGCGRSVAPIKAGFVARVGRRKAGTWAGFMVFFGCSSC